MCTGGWKVSWGGGGYETNYLTFGGMRQITTFVGGGYETKDEWNTMSMINKTTDVYNTIYTIKNRVYVPKCS